MSFYQFHFENPDNLAQSKLWLLATSAPLSQFNKQRHDTLSPVGSAITPEEVKDIASSLKRDWSITNKKELLDTLTTLPESKTFTAAQNNWQGLSQVEFDSLDKFDHRLKKSKSVFKMVDSYRFSLNGCGDLAWHLGRCAWLIRQACFIKLIEENDAWMLLEENGALIKKAFSSWEQFGISYTVGAQYWRRDEYGEPSIREFKDVLTFLLTNKDSPWLHVNWDQ